MHPRPATRLQECLPSRWSALRRWPSKNAADLPAYQPWAGRSSPTPDEYLVGSGHALLFPLQLLESKVLRRPVESAQYISIRYSERLAEAGIQPSVGSEGDSYDNALAESSNGLYKAELVHRRSSLKLAMGGLVQP